MNRKDFYPFLEKYTYLDAAGSTLKPKIVVKAINDFYSKYPLNPHSNMSLPGNQINQKIYETREVIAKFINADPEGIVFNSGTTEGLNTIANMLVSQLKKGDEIILSCQEHVSNLIPWMEVARKNQFVCRILPVDIHESLTIEEIVKNVTDKTKIISLAGMTNVKGSKVDFSQLREKVGKGVILICDAAQLIAHQLIDFQKWDLDFLTFSSTKMYGPFGSGVMACKPHYLSTLKPLKFGGGSYAKLDDLGWTPLPDYRAFEAGTMHPEGIIGMQKAFKYVQKIGFQKIIAQEKKLLEYTYTQLKKIKSVKLYTNSKNDINIVFNINNAFAWDVANYLSSKNILIRAGKQCNPLIHKKIPSTIRISFGLYNDFTDIDKLVKALNSNEDFTQYTL